MVVVVFGARGNVGRHVADGLLAVGEQARAVSRTPAAGLTPGLEAVAADLERPETLPAALDGADKVFLYGMLNP
ncbi:NAD(P)H-binding protein [Streptomyces sp. NPDC001982]|uniref:SDR family oxidoreductase n=1 Tax=unclassified Streptomyces TaxID=2593676 RepID=UPI003324C4C6